MNEPLGLSAIAASGASYTPLQPLTLRRDPIRLAFSRAPWASGWYLLGYLFIGTALCAVALSAATVGVTLGITLAGLPVLLGAASVARRLLSEPADPLEEAKEVLRSPGPLSAAEAASHPVF